MKDEQVDGTIANDLIGNSAIPRIGVPSLWKVRHCRQSAYPRSWALTGDPNSTSALSDAVKSDRERVTDPAVGEGSIR